jgi:hypothetical protein
MTKASHLHERKMTGAGMLVIVMMIFIVLVALGMFTFEVSRIQLAQRQLIEVCDAAALTGTSMFATMDNSDPANLNANQKKAMQYALQMCCMNQCVGDSMGSAVLVNPDGVPATTPATKLLPVSPHKFNIYMQYCDPLNNFKAVDISNTGLDANGQPLAAAGRALQVFIAYGEVPPFGRFLGLGSYPVQGNSVSGMARLDVVLAFDCSGSMDDQTLVTFVQRYDNGGKLVCKPVPSPTSPHWLSNYLQLDTTNHPEGSAVNLQYPLGLAYAQDKTMYKNALVFNGSIRSAGPNDSGCAPGSGTPAANEFTDVVVNIAQPPTPSQEPYTNATDNFTPFTYTDPSGASFNFNSLDTVVEASRGNLESAALYAGSMANTNPNVVGPQPGIYKAYWTLAAQYSQPIATALQSATQDFFTQLNKASDVHFGLVCFANPSATETGNSTLSRGYVSSDPSGNASYLPPVYGKTAASGTFQIPGIPLSKTQDNYTNCTTAMTTIVPMGQTYTGDSLTAARKMFDPSSNAYAARVATKTAIVLFTDGPPTGGVAGSQAQIAQTEAKNCEKLGTAIYCIGLSQNPTLIPLQQQFLNDADGSSGIAALSGNGARFFPCSSSADVRAAFANIARRLVVLRTN